MLFAYLKRMKNFTNLLSFLFLSSVFGPPSFALELRDLSERSCSSESPQISQINAENICEEFLAEMRDLYFVSDIQNNMPLFLAEYLIRQNEIFPLGDTDETSPLDFILGRNPLLKNLSKKARELNLKSEKKILIDIFTALEKRTCNGNECDVNEPLVVTGLTPDMIDGMHRLIDAVTPLSSETLKIDGKSLPIKLRLDFTGDSQSLLRGFRIDTEIPSNRLGQTPLSRGQLGLLSLDFDGYPRLNEDLVNHSLGSDASLLKSSSKLAEDWRKRGVAYNTPDQLGVKSKTQLIAKLDSKNRERYRELLGLSPKGKAMHPVIKTALSKHFDISPKHRNWNKLWWNKKMEVNPYNREYMLGLTKSEFIQTYFLNNDSNLSINARFAKIITDTDELNRCSQLPKEKLYSIGERLLKSLDWN